MKIITGYLLFTLVVAHPMVSNSLQLNGKIMSEDPVVVTEMRYMAALKRKGIQFCSGSLISPRHVLTTASCVTRIFDFGEIAFSEIKVLLGDKIHDVNHIIHDPCYNDRIPIGSCSLSVGLVMIDDLIFASDKVKWIEISENIIPQDTEAEIIGWNCLESIAGRYVLNKIKVKVLDDKICSQLLWPRKLRPELMMCVFSMTSKKKQIFKQDSGSPLVLDGKIIGTIIHLQGLNDNITVIIRASAYKTFIEREKMYMAQTEN